MPFNGISQIFGQAERETYFNFRDENEHFFLSISGQKMIFHSTPILEITNLGSPKSILGNSPNLNGPLNFRDENKRKKKKKVKKR